MAEAESRRGRQTPTASLVLPYHETRGAEAIELYNATGRTAQEWQTLMIYDILGVNDKGLYTHSKFGYAVPGGTAKTKLSLSVNYGG